MLKFLFKSICNFYDFTSFLKKYDIAAEKRINLKYTAGWMVTEWALPVSATQVKENITGSSEVPSLPLTPLLQTSDIIVWLFWCPFVFFLALCEWIHTVHFLLCGFLYFTLSLWGLPMQFVEIICSLPLFNILWYGHTPKVLHHWWYLVVSNMGQLQIVNSRDTDFFLLGIYLDVKSLS